MSAPKHIGLPECVLGHVYRIRSRNLVVGVYDGKQGFIGIRNKFGQEYLFTEYHWDQGPPHGTVHPIDDIGVLPNGILPVEDMGTVCKKTGRPVVWRTEPQFRRSRQDGGGSFTTSGSWCYEGTDDIIPEYPESQAVTVSNQALFRFIVPLREAEYARREEERGGDLVTCSGCTGFFPLRETLLVDQKRLCPKCRG